MSVQMSWSKRRLTFLSKKVYFIKCHNLSTRFVVFTNPCSYRRLNLVHIPCHLQFPAHPDATLFKTSFSVAQVILNSTYFELNWTSMRHSRRPHIRDIRCSLHAFLTWHQHKNNLHFICSPSMTLFAQHHESLLITVVKALSFVALLSIIIVLGLMGPILSKTACKISLNAVASWSSW